MRQVKLTCVGFYMHDTNFSFIRSNQAEDLKKYSLTKKLTRGAHLLCTVSENLTDIEMYIVLSLYTVSGKKEATLFSTTALAFLGRFL